MSRAVVGLLLSMVLGCGDPEASTLASAYDLTEVSGTALPIALSPSLTLVRGELRFTNGRFEETLVFTSATGTSTSRFAGNVTVRGDRVQLADIEQGYVHTLESSGRRLVTTGRTLGSNDLDVLRIFEYTRKE